MLVSYANQGDALPATLHIHYRNDLKRAPSYNHVSCDCLPAMILLSLLNEEEYASINIMRHQGT